VKSGPVDRLYMTYLSMKKFLKLLPSCKFVNPLQRSYLKENENKINYKKMKMKEHMMKNALMFEDII